MKVALIMPYWGKLPKYFNLWEYSASLNKDFDFFIFTDIKFNSKYPNIKIIHYTLDDFRSNTKNLIGFNPKIKSAYKIVDYKPLYGVLFQEYIKDYSHWGYCDSDVIWGNLSKFITDEILISFDRIYKHGHLTIYKNIEEVNYRWKTNHNIHSYIYSEVYKVYGVKMFDERGGLWDIYDENNYSSYINTNDFADLIPTVPNFQSPNNTIFSYFYFDNGMLKGYIENNQNLEEIELAYVHLQKRQMLKPITNASSFYIKPDNFILRSKSVNKTKGNTLRIIKAILKKDEFFFHLKVAIRRFKMYMKRENRDVKYKLF